MANIENDTFDHCIICEGPYIEGDLWLSRCYLTAGFDPKDQRPINYQTEVSYNHYFHQKYLMKNLWATEGFALEEYENVALERFF
jgi:hypothetical protein